MDDTNRPPGEFATVTLVPTGPGPPFAIRLRNFLKLALRGYGLRNAGLIVARIDNPSTAAQDAAAGQPGAGNGHVPSTPRKLGRV